MELIGQSVPRREDHRFLTGTGRYVADIKPEGVLQAAIVRSGLAAARILSIDVRAALASDGVVAVFTGEDLQDEMGPLPQLTTPQPRFADAFDLRSDPPDVPCIATDVVRYVGEPVAVVIASDRYLAEDAAELVDVSYEPLEPIVDVDAALADDARPVHDQNPGNVGLSVAYRKGEIGEPDDQHVVVERTLHVGRHSGVPLEARGVVAEPTATGGVDVWTSTQVPFLVRRAICGATGWSPEQVRVRAPDVGGGFGPKANVYGEEVIVPVIARRLGRPIQWIEDRYEHLVSAAQSRDQVHRTRLVVDPDGRIVSWEDRFTVDIGAHNLWMSGVVANTAIHLLGAYRIPRCRISGKAVFTNKTPTSQYRGAGRPEATFALERSLDAAADALGISRLKLRELNILNADDFPYPQDIPYRDGVDIIYDGRDYGAVLKACQALVPEQDVLALTQREAQVGRLVGVGVATFVEATGRGPFEVARATVLDDGRVRIGVGTASAGMAHETTLAQIAASVLRRDYGDVEVISADTDNVTEALGSFASRTAVVAGGAIHEACDQLVAQARQDIAQAYEVEPAQVVHVDDGFTVGQRQVRWGEVAGPIRARSGRADDGPLESTGRFEPETVTWTMGAHLAVVSVDPATGMIKVLRYAAADEAGRPINPAVVEGQVRGGIAQGIGGALLEEFRYDQNGQPTSTSFAEYLLPGTGEIPHLDLDHIEVPSERNRLGFKGVGESGTIPGCAVLAAAVEDALREFDVQVSATPVLPMHVRSWLREVGR